MTATRGSWLGFARCAAFVCAFVPSGASSAFVRVRVGDAHPKAAYEAWVVTSLDLSDPSQPFAKIALPANGVEQELPWPDQPAWLFLHQRFQPVGGPPVDLMLPHDLRAASAPPERTVSLRAVDPVLLVTREKVSFRPVVLTRIGVLLLLLLGAGLGTRWFLRHDAARPGRRTAPLSDAVQTPTPRWALTAVGGALVAACALRLPGLAGQPLDLLEMSYLPGIGRPAPLGEGATWLQRAGSVLEELGALYCLDLVHPPLWHVVLGAAGLTLPGEAGLRIPSLLASLIGLVVSWRLLRRVSEPAGVAAAWLAAFAMPSVYFGQDATPYAFVGACSLGTVLALLRANEHGTARGWVWFFGLLVAAFLAHYNVAMLGGAMVLALLAAAWTFRSDRRWRAGLRLAAGVGLLLAPLPLAWSWLHFSTFPTVAQDTRLFADAYARDPGLVRYLTQFAKVTAGIRADAPGWALFGALPLVGLGALAGFRSSDGRARLLSYALVAGTAGWVASIVFFWSNARTHLNGHIYWGFRWVSWYHPLMLATAALGLCAGRMPLPARLAAGAVWLAGLLPSTASNVLEPTRPDFRGAAELILAELEDGDAIATVPAWFERGTLAYYLFQTGRLQRYPEAGEGAWRVGGKRLTIETVHQGLPFQSSARNGHVRRLWVLDVRGEMFGQPEFDGAVADDAIAWADRVMRRDGAWEFRSIGVLRYVPDASALQPPTTPIEVSAWQVPLTLRTYPQLRTPITLKVPSELTDTRPGPALRWQAPMTPPCVEYAWRDLADALKPEADTHGYLELRFPPGPAPEVVVTSPGAARVRATKDGYTVTAVGEPCDGRELRLSVSAAE